MSWIFTQNAVKNSVNTRSQYEYLQAHRELHNNAEMGFSSVPVPGMKANASSPVPYPIYAEMDRQTKAIMEDPAQGQLLADLMPLARPLNIGKIMHQYRQSGDGGAVTTSVSGLEPIPNDRVGYKYDSAIVPVHQSGYFREWREMAGMQSSDFDDLLDDQNASTRTVRQRMADYALDGLDGLEFKGVEAYGIRNSANTASVTIGGSTDLTTDGPEAVRAEFVRILGKLRIDNRVTEGITVYISPEIEANLANYFVIPNQLVTGRTIRDEIASLPGVVAVKTLNQLKDNEVVMGVLSNEYIVPLVGQAVSNLALPRQTPFARHQFLVWSAMGLQIRTDYNGRTGWLYASKA